MIANDVIELRPVRAADIALLRQWESDPQVADMLATTATLIDARESPEQEYDRLLRTPRVKLLAIHRKVGALVGFVRLHDLDLQARKAVVRLFVAPEFQGQGMGTAALQTLLRFCYMELGLHRVGLVVREDNTRALALYQRLGFAIEGRERDAAWVTGHWVSFLQMGLLADEWHAGQV